MSDGPEWFAPKRYGYGAGLPISWQGWALTLGFVADRDRRWRSGFGDRPIQLIAVLVPLSVVFHGHQRPTTRGGWRWRWGEEE